MSKHTLEILRLLREINDLEKTNSLLSITTLYNNNIDIINSNNLIILKKKKLLEFINQNVDKYKEENKEKNKNINQEKKEEIKFNNEYQINKETNKYIENKPSLQELNTMNKKELLRIKEEKRKAKELLYSTH